MIDLRERLLGLMGRPGALLHVARTRGVQHATNPAKDATGGATAAQQPAPLPREDRATTGATAADPRSESPATAAQQDEGEVKPSAILGADTTGVARANSRRHRLTKAEGDAAHAEVWDAAAIGRFLARVAAFRRRGFGEQDADDLAERAHLLEVQAEGRALCLDCRYLTGTTATGWRCGNRRTGGVARDLAGELATTPMRCPGSHGRLAGAVESEIPT